MSESKTFLIKGSSPDPYEVTFKRREDQRLNAYCTCPASEFGMYCKHRIRILKGSTDNIISGNKNDVAVVVDWLKNTDLELILNEFGKLESEEMRIKKELQMVKKILARTLIK